MIDENIYYCVGTKKFNNKFLAAREAVATGKNIYFDLHDAAFDQCNWLVEPAETWDQLLDIRANQLAAKNKPIVLNFSGGTDSLTIYEVFKRNNIHIDVIYLRVRLGANGAEDESLKTVYEFLNRGVYSSNTKVVVRDESPRLLEEMYSDPDWIWTKGLRYHFSVDHVVDSNNFQDSTIENILKTDDYISVTGVDKPRLLFTDHGVYSYQDDTPFTRKFSSNVIDCFYISPDLPELHIKQSYMLLKHIKSLNPLAKSPAELMAFNDFHNPNKFHWLDYSINGCGRYGDINQSPRQHLLNGNSALHIPESGIFSGSEYKGRGRDWYQSLVGTQVFKNYTQGIMSVASDAAGKYLLTDPTNFYSIKPIKSKHYRLAY